MAQLGIVIEDSDRSTLHKGDKIGLLLEQSSGTKVLRHRSLPYDTKKIRKTAVYHTFLQKRYLVQ